MDRSSSCSFRNGLLVFVALATALAVNLRASTPLKIAVEGSRYLVGQLAKVSVTNTGRMPIIICLACCGTIIDAKTDQVVPDFDVQVRGPRRWGHLLWGCDVGNCFAPSILAAGQTREFRLKFPQAGRYRLRLYYVPDANARSQKPVTCPNLPSAVQHKEATSNMFVVSERAQ